MNTPDESDDEGPPKVRFPHFKVPENDEDVKFKVELQFINKKQILEAIKTFGIMSKKNLKVKKMTRRESLQSVKKKRVVRSTYGVEKWEIRLTMDQAYRVKVKAMEKIESATRDQYKHHTNL